MTRSLQHFGEDDEAAAATMRSLDYSEEEIGRTLKNPAIAGLNAEEKLRTSLRALDAEHSDRVQRQAEQRAPAANPKLFDKQEKPSGNPDEAYERGRRDERFLKRNDPNYVKPQRQPRPPRPPSARQQKAQLMGPAKKLSALARMAKR